MLTGAYNKNTPTKKDVTSMDNTNKEINVLEVEEIEKKAQMIAGLSSVLVVFFDNIYDDYFQGALECLEQETRSLRNLFNTLSKKLYK